MSDKNESKHAGKVIEDTSSHNMEGDYVVLMETSGKECESWYYFIKYNGNEEALAHLQSQLEKIDWYIYNDLSTFDLDLEHKVPAPMAKLFTKLDLNAYSFHRKFDGKLKKIDLKLSDKDKTKKKMAKAFDVLGYGQIEDYVSDEDIDPEDLRTDSDSGSSDTRSCSSESESESSESEEELKKNKKKVTKVPTALLAKDLPGWVKAKQKKH